MELIKSLSLLLPLIITLVILCLSQILDLSIVKALKYRNRKLSKIVSEAFKQDCALLLTEEFPSNHSLDKLKKKLLSKKTIFITWI